MLFKNHWHDLAKFSQQTLNFHKLCMDYKLLMGERYLNDSAQLNVSILVTVMIDERL